MIRSLNLKKEPIIYHHLGQDTKFIQVICKMGKPFGFISIS